MSCLDVLYSHTVYQGNVFLLRDQCQQEVFRHSGLLRTQTVLYRHKPDSQEQVSLQTNKPRFQQAFTVYDIKTSHKRDLR